MRIIGGQPTGMKSARAARKQYLDSDARDTPPGLRACPSACLGDHADP